MVKKNAVAAAPEVIDSVDALEAKLAHMREAQKVFATYTQEQVDKIFYEAAMAANKQRIPLAKLAVEDTGRGIVEDKVIKNHYAAEYIYNAYKNTKTCGVVEHHQPHLHRDLQVPHLPEDPQRHHHLPAPGSSQVHHRRRQGRA